MNDRRRTKRVLLGGLAAAVILMVVWQVISSRKPGWGEYGFDPRRPGTIEDISHLSERDDINVLFILVDTLRAHRLGSYGYSRDTSPTFNYLAHTGLRFDRHLAQSSWTKSSMASLWTGLNPARSGILKFSHGFPQEATLVAEIFRDAGFRTTGIFRNGWVAPNFGFDQGFEVYYRPPPTTPNTRLRQDNPHVTLEGSDEDVTDAALEFLRTNGRDRWFLYLHLMDVHQYVYDQDSAVFGSDYSDIYDNAILHTDRLISRFLYKVGEMGLMEHTIVVLAADHGEAFRERGLEGHARHVYRETIEVPLIISLPFRLEPGITLRSDTRNVDVWPTLLDMLGLPPLPDTDGRSLMSEILSAGRGAAPSEAPPGIAHLDAGWARRGTTPQPRVAVLERDHRFIYEVGPSGAIREELFDRRSDPIELKNVIQDEPELASHMRTLAKEYLERTASPWGTGTSNVELNEMELNQLRALGYAVP
jgi:arylsulfatase A-like enzyme